MIFSRGLKCSPNATSFLDPSSAPCRTSPGWVSLGNLQRYSSATLAAKSLQWEMDWAQMCLPDAAGLSNTRICAMAASCTCTAPIQMSLYSSVQPATTNRPASILYFLLHY
ncbi:Pentatricopeptide repeat-containing protein mitochondrial [Zea mays]|uniref:Pentatricopeptide repeat-containing protein mitochondrial n=1 Tax=Zea mays TaxID=4577 RepID=A0A1D6GEM2_MAIZE|nr:Pentatricopeptide repeat-containing protein mitochondrial [Zea mays]